MTRAVLLLGAGYLGGYTMAAVAHVLVDVADALIGAHRDTRRALRREVDRVLAELDQANPGTLDLRDQVWTPAMLDRLWREVQKDPAPLGVPGW